MIISYIFLYNIKEKLKTKIFNFIKTFFI